MEFLGEKLSRKKITERTWPSNSHQHTAVTWHRYSECVLAKVLIDLLSWEITHAQREGEQKSQCRASLVVQWLRIYLPTQGTWVQSLVGKLKSHIRSVAKVMSDSFATPWTVACQVPLSMGISQAGILKWVAISSSRGSNLHLLYCRWILYHWATHSTFCRALKPMYHNYRTCMLWSHAPQLERIPHAITRESVYCQERSHVMQWRSHVRGLKAHTNR